MTYKALLELSEREGPVTLNELPTMPTYLALPLAEDPDKFIPVHEMFHMHAIQNPNRIALSCAERNQVISYGGLDCTSTLRAHGTFRLRSKDKNQRLTMNKKCSGLAGSPPKRLSSYICNGASA